ncbi:Pentatricopeptide repeat-containing protein [Rhynchospora pubera]|uniref:Pentatricopeptide repeat-containing protein n=1 Tax=Rhynchospora pubera TaxID=906938 RepID=A0AAV8H872_9POAL|nr:Pentatricopeptide repeat-containing protein [Rhynchospora pubera]
MATGTSLAVPVPVAERRFFFLSSQHGHERKHRRKRSKVFSSSSSSSEAIASDHNHQIQVLCKQGNLALALQLLPHEPNPTQRTFHSLILASNTPSSASAIHRSVIHSPFHSDPFLSTCLIAMYSRLRLLSQARQVFHNTPSKTIFVWNAMLKALLADDEAEDALSLFCQMNCLGVHLDSYTFSFALKSCIACSADSSSAPYRLKQIHSAAIRRGYDSQVHVATTLLDCYSKLGFLSYAQQVFHHMSLRTLVTWTAMIGCYARNEQPYDALNLFRQMVLTQDPHLTPNAVTIISVLLACAGLAALGQGKILHGYILRRELDSVLSVNNALVSMYIKSGSTVLGHRVFDHLDPRRRDAVSWNSLISGYAMHGFYQEAIQVFDEMVQSGVSPTAVSFVSVLGACSHCGLVEEGKMIFQSMTHKYNVVPCIEHYACMVDLLGRAGQLDEAVKLIEEMPLEPSPQLWGSLLGACRKFGNVEYAELACSHLFELEPKNSGNYVLLADVYTKAQMPEEVDRVKKLLEEQSLPKLAGCSWIEVFKKVCSFVSVDEMNPQIEEIDAFLVELVAAMKIHGYEPNTKVILYDLEQEEKERMLLRHSEKLALAFGLINGKKGEVIRITKNLRLCEDCHSFTKLVSKFTKRDIFVRDVNRFHHFKDGVCSCMDYW